MSTFGFPTTSLSGFPDPTGFVDPTGFTGDPTLMSNPDLTTPAPSPVGTFVDLGNGNLFASSDPMGQMFDANGNPVRANNGAGTAPGVNSIATLISSLANAASSLIKAFQGPPKTVFIGGSTAQMPASNQQQSVPAGQVPQFGSTGGGFLIIGAIIVGAVLLSK